MTQCENYALKNPTAKEALEACKKYHDTDEPFPANQIDTNCRARVRRVAPFLATDGIKVY